MNTPDNSPQTLKLPKYLTILVMLFVAIYLTTGMVQYRLIAVGPVYFSSAIYIYPLSYLISDIVAEVYGYRMARQLIWCGMSAWILAGLFLTFVIHLNPPAFWLHYAKQYDFIMQPYLKYALASAFGVLVGQFFNIYIISKLKILLHGRHFWFRSVFSSFFGDTITISIALTFIYWGYMPFSRIFEIISYELVINIIYTAVIAWPALYSVNFLKRAENLDIYDTDIDFNPFKFQIDK